VPARRITLLDVPFDVVDFAETLDRLVAMAQGARHAYVVTANVDHVVRYHREPDVRSLYTEADLVVADGMPLIWASRLLGDPLPERVAGSDLFPALCGRAADLGLSVFLLGGAPGTADRAATVLLERHPALRVTTYCPPFGFEKDAAETDRAVSAVRDVRPDILFVGLGSPKQEKWIVQHGAACGPRLSIGVGISFSFVSGDVPRAPRWMQRAGLEWLHRLGREPGRLWKRYLWEDRVFLYLVMRDLGRRWFSRSGRTRAD
jgi:N-acetylglucosaminyldiphosphoundecaprenol N-acetyl-beta-D-mannosaminyltransferase